MSVIDDGARHLLREEDRHATLTQMVDRVRASLTAEIGAALARHQKGHAPLQMRPIVHARHGGVAEQLAALATEIRAQLVVVGTHGRRGVRQYIMGSVAERIVRLAPCPVLVVRPTDFHAMDDLPALDPPCPACVEEREKSEGARWWCAAHEAWRSPAHTYSFSGQLTDPHAPLNHLL